MASDPLPGFAGLLRRARREAELTQEALAERAGISVRGISDLERGIIRVPRRDTLDLLLDALDLPAEERAIWRKFRDEAASQPRSASPAVNVDLPLIVGRDRELDVLSEQLDLALAGHGRLVLVSGEAGIGKTRLAEWVAAEAQRRGAVVLWGHCYEREGAPAFWPWIQVLRGCIAVDDVETVREAVGTSGAHIAQILPEIEQLTPDSPALPAMNPEQARFHLFDAITRLFKHLAGVRSRLIILEDLHWADAPTVLLLQFLSREIRDGSLLVVATFRNVEVQRQHPISATLATLSREPITQRLDLHPLTLEAVQTLIEEVFGRSNPAGIAQTVWWETEGNPFFLTEVVRLLEAEGWPDLPADVPWKIRVPESIRETIGQRLNQLSPECIELLAVAAVAGREFNLPILEITCGKRAVDLLPLLDEAERAQIIEGGNIFGQYRFHHRLIQEAIYDDLPASQRFRLHLRIGEALEERYAVDLREHYGALAHHYAQAPLGVNVDKAIDYATKAAEQALRQVAWEEAVSYYEQALQVLDLHAEPTPEQRCDLLLALGSAKDTAGSGRGSTPGTVLTDARSTYWQAVEAARAAGSVAHLARATSGLSYGLFAGVPFTDQRIVPLLEEVLAQLPGEDSAERALIQANLSAAYRNFKMFSGIRMPAGTETAIEQLSAEAVTIANRIADPRTMAICLIAHQTAVWHPGRSVELRSLADEILNLEIPDDYAQYDIQTASSHAAFRSYMSQGDIAAGKRLIDQMVIRYREISSRVAAWSINVFQAGIALSEGRYEEAAALMGEADAIWPNTGIVCNQTFALCREQDRLEDAAPRLKPIRDTFPQSPWFRVCWMLYLLETGQEEDARRLFDDVDLADLADLARGMYWAHVLALYAELCAAFEAADRARACYRLLEPYPEHVIYCGYIYYCAGTVSHYLGLLASVMGEWRTADSHFEHALATHHALGYHPLVAYTQYAWARMLLKRDGPGDLMRARDLIDQALETAERLGMVRLRRLAAALDGAARR